MKSVVLCCAGIGSRLGMAQTKALIAIEGKTLIAWQLEMLHEVEDLRIVVGFQAQDVVNEVLRHRRDVLFVYNHNYFENKTAASFYYGARDGYNYAVQWDGDLLIHPDDARLCLETEGEYVAYSDRVSEDAVLGRTNAAGEVLSFSRSAADYEWTGPACIGVIGGAGVAATNTFGKIRISTL